MNIPSWSAARSGLLGDTGAVDASAQIDQFLGTHPDTVIYQGNAVVSPDGSGGGVSAHALNAYDTDQPFVMSGTSIGRISLPVLAVGTGADLIVSLCTDNAGVPGTVITQVRIPANWITQLSAVSATAVAGSNADTVLNATGNPLALAQFNSWRMYNYVHLNWPYPSATANGSAPACSTFYGNYLILVGGADSSHNTVSNVYTAYCDTEGTLFPSVSQPALPSTADGSGKMTVGIDSSTGDPVVVLAGGSPTYAGAAVNTTYTAQFNATTGSISSWAVQANLPYIVANQGMAAANGYVYVIAGTSSGVAINTVVYGQIQNAQITSWTATSPLPQTLQLPYCCVSNNFLFVMGGINSTLSVSYNTCYYAPIKSDGSLGAWITGPTFPGTGYNLDTTSLGTTFGVLTEVGGPGPGNVNMIGVTPNGLDVTWNNEDQGGGGSYVVYVPISDGVFRYYGAASSAGFGYNTMVFKYLPKISVPLPATGLTNGATYHILVQSPSTDLNNYIALPKDNNALPSNPISQYRAKGATTWTSAGDEIPLTVYDATATGQVWHTWEDSGERISTLAYATTPDQRLIGVLDATQQPGPVLNQNWSFTAGTAPWGGNNGTLVQSSSFTHGDLPFSAQLTPNGVSSQAYIESELNLINLQQPYAANCWFYSPTGYSNCEILINWYTAAGFSGGYISSATGATTNVAAGVWTALTVTGTPPTNAVYATIGVYERGTPPATAIFYVSAATLQSTIGPQLSSVAQIDYGGTFTTGSMWPPTGVTVLA